MLEGLAARIGTVGRLADLLSQPRANAKVELASYLRQVSEAAVSVPSAAGAIELRFDGEAGCWVTADEALSLGLIVDELVTNAVRYAHPTGVAGMIRVSCSRTCARFIRVAVSDDGVGLPEGLDPRESNHFGMRLVHSLATELRAAIAFADSGLGLSVAVQIPAR